MGAISQDLRYALRTMRQNPGFTLIAVLALALGIGANTAIFSVVNGILLKPLPYADPDRLVQIFETEPELPSVPVNMPDYLDWKKQARSFQSLAMYNNYGVANLTGDGPPERVLLMDVESTMLPVLGMTPVIGRNFTPEENQPGRGHVVMLSTGFWKSRFAGDRKVLGRTIRLNHEPYVIIGVLPPQVKDEDVWLPLSFDLAAGENHRGNHGHSVVGRLAPGVSVEQAAAELKTLAAGLEKQYPRENQGVGAKVMLKSEAVTGRIQTALWTLLGAVGCVLLIASANVANLLLARAASRQKEIGVRFALGAGRARIIQQLLTESVLMSLLAAGIGMLLAMWTVDVVRGLDLQQIPRLDEVVIDWHVLLFTAAVSIFTALLFGLVPALKISREGWAGMLKQASGRTTESGAHRRLRKTLVGAEAALATILLIGSGLLIRSFVQVAGIDPGFQPRNVLTMRMMLPESRYGKPGQIARFAEGVTERVRTIPGVQSAALVTKLPLEGGNNGTIMIEGKPRGKNLWDSPLVEFSRATPGYFRAMGIPMLNGRDFNSRDREGSQEVVIISQTFARRFFPGQDPIGKHVAYETETPKWKEVIGVVGDVRQWGLESKPIPEIYMPISQEEPSWLTLVVRTNTSPLTFTNGLTSQIRAVDPEQAVFDVRTMERVVGEQLGWRTFNTTLLVCFGLIAMTLAAIGIYGVISYSVMQRIPEIGIRMALGAQPGGVLRMIVRQGMAPAVMGAVAGVLLSLLATRLLSSLLYGVTQNDALTYVAVGALLIVVAALAAYIPAHRAAGLDPLRALRYE